MKIKWKIIWLVILLIAEITTIHLTAQKVLLDEPLQAGELTLFPAVDNPNHYYYILDKVRFAQHENGEPQFSFLRYVQTEASAPGTEDIEEGQGGGIVHAVVELYTSIEDVRQAERELRRINSEGEIKGQLLFESGIISLISSFKADNKEWTKRVLGFGTAAIMANHGMAISIQLTKQGSEILWNSFKTPTPDMSVSFEMKITGYRSPKQVIIEADFDQVYKHQIFEAASVTPVFAGEIKKAFDELEKSGVIKVTQYGEDEDLEKAKETAYNKLVKMIFDPAGGIGTPNLQQLNQNQEGKSMLDRATEMLANAREEVREENRLIRFENKEDEERYKELLNEVNEMVKEFNKELLGLEDIPEKPNPQQKKELPSFAAGISYQMKESRQRGYFKVDLNKYTTDKLMLRFNRNLGEGGIECKSCFKEVSLDRTLFKQREISVYLDGANADIFDHINFFHILLRKKHENGAFTYDEEKIDRSKFSLKGNQFKLLYGWNEDSDRLKWYDYEYKIECNYFGGYAFESNWISTNSGIISLVPKFTKKVIDVETDQNRMVAESVRSAEVRVFYKLGDKKYTNEIRLNFNKEEFSKQIEVILPQENYTFDYEVTWHIMGKGAISSERKTTNNLILYLDEVL